MTREPTESTGGDASTAGRGDRSSEPAATDPTTRRSAGTGPGRNPNARAIPRRTVLAGLAASAAAVAGTPGFASAQAADDPARQLEALDRGLVAVAVEGGVLVRWRLFATDSDDVGFVLYRDGERVTDAPIDDRTNYLDADGSTASTYAVAPVVDGEERSPSESVGVLAENYLEIPLEKPADATDPDDGSAVTYVANDASVGDLTGDGSYDVVVEWMPENARDNAHDGATNEVILDGYTLDGSHLWRIGLGPNVRAGAHYTPFLVYDFDGDGIGEVVVRTGDGATDGDGRVIGDPNADHRGSDGRILEGPEYLTVFDGETGAELVTADFEPARGDPCDWGDCYGNRVDRFLAGVAYLDGERPSAVLARGYYEKTALVAYDYRDGELTRRWAFDSTDPGNGAYAGQGNHQLSVADVDGDGRDEIVYGAMVLDHDGTGLHATGWGHGDALHVGDFNPDRDGLEIYQCHESANSPYGASLRDAETGEIIWGAETGEDTGRAMIADIDPAHRGAEGWATSGVGAHTVDGEAVADAPSSVNFGIWWTGDRRRELLDHDGGVGVIDRWDLEAARLDRLATFEGTRSNNGTKGTPCLSADLLGDWREEVLYRTPDSEALRLYLTPHQSDHRLYTLMHDSQYRTAVAWQNAGYNQPPHPSFYLGTGMDDPPTPSVDLVGGPGADPGTTIDVGEYDARDTTGDGLHEDVTGDGDTLHEDVTAFFEHLESDGVQENPDAFDFDGDGEVGFGDVIALFEKI